MKRAHLTKILMQDLPGGHSGKNLSPEFVLGFRNIKRSTAASFQVAVRVI